MAINLPHSLVFQDKENIEDFLEGENSSLNREMLELYGELTKGNNRGFPLEVMNKAWYIAKWIFMQKEPKLLQFDRTLCNYIYNNPYAGILAYYIIERQKKLPSQISEFLQEIENLCFPMLKNKNSNPEVQRRYHAFCIIEDLHRGTTYTTNLYLEVEDSIPTADIEKATKDFNNKEIERILPYYGNIQQQLAFINIIEKAFTKRASIPTIVNIELFDYTQTAHKPDFKKLKEEIKAGKYLPEQDAALPELPENANEEAVRINEQYKQQIEQLKLRINTLKAQTERVNTQNKLDYQWQEEADEREKEIDNLVDENELLKAKNNNQANTITTLKKELTDAQNLAAENATGKNKQLTAEVEKLKQQLEESKNTNQVEWDILFYVFKDSVSPEDINSIASYLSDIISTASPSNTVELMSRLTKLKREIRENNKKATNIQELTINKHVDNEVNGVANGATGIAVNESK